MTTILFWNINKKQLINDIVWLCQRYNVDILVLAESKLSKVEILRNLNIGASSIYISPTNPTTSLSLFYRYPSESIQPLDGEKRMSIQRIQPRIGKDFTLVALHLPSKLHMSEEDQYAECRRIVQTIQEKENQVGHMRTLVIGDFNLNPFEKGMIAADGFHAMMTQKIAKKRDRKIRGQTRSFFYNPMWGRMGDFSPEAPGTYYYSDSSVIAYFWNTLDQVLLRPDLLDYFTQDNLSIISQIGEKSLLTANQTILSSSSDHFPILITLEIERTVNHE
ncbi:MAG: endonuclease/exonuclease/phosphatase family protein [Cyanobacteria bacterium P01_E01_bin.42]